MSNMDNKTILITGVAGFIGANIALKLFNEEENIHIVGIDNLNDYYDVSLKEYRLSEIERVVGKKKTCKWTFIKGDISDKQTISDIFDKYKPQYVANLAAQAGVRYSIENPDAYIKSNLIGFFNVLEACRKAKNEGYLKHLVYASSSSVYGLNTKMPYSIEDKVDTPVSLYASTKKSNELMAHAYAKLYDIPSTGLRFFTVYGPAGRPDMAYFGFTNNLIKGEKIKIFNFGNCKRDFTYIDDIVEGVVRVLKREPEKNEQDVPYKVYNIGNSQPENLLEFVDVLQQELVYAEVLPKNFNFEKLKELVPMQPGDVIETYADTSELEKDFGFTPTTPLRVGLRAFAQWYKGFYQDKIKK